MSATERRTLDGNAYALMVACSLLWGLQQVAVKAIIDDVSPVTQGAVRSMLATLLLLAWARARPVALFERDGTLPAGLLAGSLFAAEFFLIYFGLNHTTASRMVVFVYLAPPLTVLGLTIFVPGERMSLAQWCGTLLAFAGIVAAFAEGMGQGGTGETWLGDLCGVAAAALWAATTVVIRASSLARAPAAKTLFYQLALSAALLPAGALVLGEPGVVRWSALAFASLFYQGAVVAFASYLVWFWLLTRYLAGRLAVFAFLTPLAGVAFGVLLLGDPLTPLFGLAAALVAVGIVLVNVPRAR
jgi:drug/metabolite transporter (DMT)-like permease